MVAVAPVFPTLEETKLPRMPTNQNVTAGETARFTCHSDARPEAENTWYINGEKLDSECTSSFMSYSFACIDYILIYI